MIENIYWEQTTVMRVDGEISSLEKKNETVSDKDNVPSLDLFSLSLSIVKSLCETQKGIQELKSTA